MPQREATIAYSCNLLAGFLGVKIHESFNSTKGWVIPYIQTQIEYNMRSPEVILLCSKNKYETNMNKIATKYTSLA